MIHVLLIGSLFDSAISGVIPAVGVVVGGAVVGLVRNKRKETEDGRRASSMENSQLEATVKEMSDFMVGTKQTPFRPAAPGFIDRFNALEEKVDTQGDKLDTLQEGITTLLNGNGK